MFDGDPEPNMPLFYTDLAEIAEAACSESSTGIRPQGIATPPQMRNQSYPGEQVQIQETKLVPVLIPE